MNVLVAVDAHLYQTPDGKVWAKTIYGYDFWQRYLSVFESVTIVSRLRGVDYDEVIGFLRSDGNNVKFQALPMARDYKEYLSNIFKYITYAWKYTKGEKCSIIRLPSISATFFEVALRVRRKPYLIEVVVDPSTAYEDHKSLAKLLTWHLKKACLHANGVSYVTQYALQEQYPSSARYSRRDKNKYFETYYSSIVLKKDFFSIPKLYSKGKKMTIVHTANNINNYIKGHTVCIKVIKKLLDYGYDIDIYFIGDGEKRKEFENLAAELDVKNHVYFTGFLASQNEIREKLISADLFLFPTKSEGLPRALIEAMAVGLPCLSTPVNGIPELLESEFLFDPLDVDGFSNKIIQLINNPGKLNNMSIRNIEKAREYEESILDLRRKSFYEKLKNIVTKGEA